MSNKKVGSCLIVGGGIGGMQAALDLAYSEIKVYLADNKPCIGGVMAQLDKTFPTNDCAMCTMAPRLVEIGRHKDIQLLTLVDIESIKGEPGNFTVTFKKRPRYVIEEKCTGCGACVLVCPVGKLKKAKDELKPVPDEYNEGLSNRSAIYIPFPQAIPNIAVIDKENCIYLRNGKCGVCKKSCQADAIDFTQKEEIVELNVGAVILSPGYNLFDCKLKPEYGYGTYKNVIRSIEYERILSASGPFEGEILRPSDKTTPKRIAFIQCVGSRDYERDYCSAVCCMYATKESIMTKEHLGDKVQCDIFYMDIRAFSKGFEEYYQRAKSLGVNYIRCRPSSIEEIPESKNLIIKYLTEDEKKVSREYDMVVLSAGMQQLDSKKELATKLGIELDKYNFCATKPFEPINSSKEGIFVAGPFVEPKDIPETVIQASGASSKVLELLHEVKGELISKKEFPAEIDVSGQPLRIGVIVCHCGTNIASVVKIQEVVEYSKSLPDVVFATNEIYACSSDTQERIKKIIEEHKLNRVVVASCTPRTHEPLFRNTLREAGLNPYLFEMANIREHCSWPHMHEHEKATQKAKDLIRMAVAKARLIEPLQRKKVSVNKDVLVVGGGLSGMNAAISLANQGVKVYLVEKEKELGGNFKQIKYLLNGADPSEYLNSLIEKVKKNEKIHLYLGWQVTNVDGFVGNFKTTISNKEDLENSKVEIAHGAVVVATGANEYKPTEYLYGKNKKVITQRELENLITSKNNDLFAFKPETIVMIQCVGSRDAERPYCSRICCEEAVKNALKIKEINPNANIFILYIDVRTYGFIEGYYSEALKKGIQFIRYEENKKPEVFEDKDGKLCVKCFDQISGADIIIDADLVVLSSGVVPLTENKELAQMLKVPLDQNGFFLEAHMKLRPVDFATDGIFLCGLAHYPKLADESIAQSNAVASRIATVLSKDTVELEANISEVVDENCDGCAYCIDPCPYKALTLIEYMCDGVIKKTVETNESICKGCGVCQATCPKKGIFIRNFKIEQIAAMVNAALEQ